MRFLCFLFLLLFTAAVVAFAYYNRDQVTVQFADYSVTASVAAIAGAAYVLGMLSGWAMFRMVRRSAGEVLDAVDHRMARARA